MESPLHTPTNGGKAPALRPKMEFQRSRWSSSTLVEQDSHSEVHEDIQQRTRATSKYENVVNMAGIAGRKPRLDFTNSLQILVGDEGCFVVPENRITQRSQFFRDYCVQHATDGEEMTVVEPPGDDRFLFDMYLQVVYQNKVIIPQNVKEADDPHWSISTMTRTYMLADRLEDLASCNIIVDSLIDFCSERELVLVSEDWNLIFNDDYKGSALRRLAVDFVVIATQPDFLQTQVRRMPAEMARDCAQRFAERMSLYRDGSSDGGSSMTTTSVADLDRCKHYHQHSKYCPPCLTPSLTGSGGARRQPLVATVAAVWLAVNILLASAVTTQLSSNISVTGGQGLAPESRMEVPSCPKVMIEGG